MFRNWMLTEWISLGGNPIKQWDLNFPGRAILSRPIQEVTTMLLSCKCPDHKVTPQVTVVLHWLTPLTMTQCEWKVHPKGRSRFWWFSQHTCVPFCFKYSNPQKQVWEVLRSYSRKEAVCSYNLGSRSLGELKWESLSIACFQMRMPTIRQQYINRL